MSNENRESPSPIELARYRQLPEHLDEQLVPEALHMIRALAHGDPDIDLALKGLNDEQLQVLKNAQTVEDFKGAILDAFSDRSIYVISGALGNLDTSIDVMSGRAGNNLEEIFGGNKEVISRVKEIRATARDILRYVRSDILDPDRQNNLVPIS